jgi:hypothetical protein
MDVLPGKEFAAIKRSRVTVYQWKARFRENRNFVTRVQFRQNRVFLSRSKTQAHAPTHRQVAFGSFYAAQINLEAITPRQTGGFIAEHPLPTKRGLLWNLVGREARQNVIGRQRLLHLSTQPEYPARSTPLERLRPQPKQFCYLRKVGLPNLGR